MADYSKQTRRFERIEYVLSSPTNWAEIGKTFAGIRQDLGEDAAKWDDAATVEARDDEIVVWFEREITSP